MTTSLTVEQALEALRPQLAAERFILGIAGPPAVGKSTVAEQVVQWATAAGIRAVVVPMDGFHLAQHVLDARGDAAVKGAPHTFDAGGYAELLRRIRSQRLGGASIWAPLFDRSIENAIAGSIGISGEDRLVVTEGNYVLLPQDPWATARRCLDECWYLELPDDVRRERLTARHRDFGRSAHQAEQRANGSDEANALLVAAAREAADLIVRTG